MTNELLVPRLNGLKNTTCTFRGRTLYITGWERDDAHITFSTHSGIEHIRIADLDDLVPVDDTGIVVKPAEILEVQSGFKFFCSKLEETLSGVLNKTVSIEQAHQVSNLVNSAVNVAKTELEYVKTAQQLAAKKQS